MSVFKLLPGKSKPNLMRLSLRILLQVIILTLSVQVMAIGWKTNRPIDQNMILTVQLKQTSDFEKLYKKGARAFLVDFNNIRPQKKQYSNEKASQFYHKIFAQYLTPIFRKLKTNNQEIIILIIKGGDLGINHLESYLTENNLFQLCYNHPTNKQWALPSDLLSLNKRIIIFNHDRMFTPKWLSYIWANTFQSTLSSPKHIVRGNITNDFSWLTINQNSIDFFEEIKNVWQQNSRMPNFIFTPQEYLNEVSTAVDKLQKLDFISGQITCNKRFLEQITWKSLSSISSGKFELLFNEADTITLIPQKDGFKFHPVRQIITKSQENKNCSFSATGMNIEEQQIGFFSFDTDFLNLFNQKLTPYTFGPSLIKDDIRGKVALFSGKDLFQIDLSNYYNETSLFSTAFWVKIDDFSHQSLHLLEARGDNNLLLHIRNRKVYLSTDGAEIFSPSELNYKWNHIAITIDNKKTASLYINGRLVNSLSVAEYPINADKLFFGQRRGRHFSGKIDNLRLWNRALSWADIQNLYEKEYKTPTLKDNLVAYYPLKESAEDESSVNSLNGTPTDILFAPDSTYGQVAQFNGTTSYIDCGNSSQFDITNVITVAAWIKPTLLKDHIAIVGKGFAYSAKMWEDYMLFTTTFISDHRPPQSILQLNKWQHVAYVFNAGGTVQFYHNGEMIYETLASPLSSYSNSFFIGRNLWGQFFKGSMTQLYVWNRALSPEEIRTVYNQNPDGESILNSPLLAQSKTNQWWWILALLSGALGTIIIYTIVRKVKTTRITTLKQIKTTQDKQTINTINVFGGFSVFDKEGNEITNKFTPKLRQLFLAILLFQFHNKKGITSKQLNELLWPNYSPQSAKNIRSTNMQQLRALLSTLDNVELIYENRYWHASIGPDAYCDFKLFNQLVRNTENLTNLPATEQVTYLKEFIKVVEKGPILPGLDLAWLDDFKGDITNSVLEVLSTFIQQHQDLIDKKLLVLLLNTILQFDSVNEEAMTLKVRTLCDIGKSSVARTTYDKFAKEYLLFYGEPYANSLQEIMHEQNSMA